MNFTPEQLARLAQTPHMDLMLQRGRAVYGYKLCHIEILSKLLACA